MTLPSELELQRAVVIAIGGNAPIADGQQGTIDQQFGNARAAAREVAKLARADWRIVVTHGNGPQVGFILLRSEMHSGVPFIPRLSLDMCVADSQGGVGYILDNSLLNELARCGLQDRAVCLLTQTVVAFDDPAFQRPTKPIGSAYTAAEASVRREREGWTMVEEAGRGSPSCGAVADATPNRRDARDSGLARQWLCRRRGGRWRLSRWLSLKLGRIAVSKPSSTRTWRRRAWR